MSFVPRLLALFIGLIWLAAAVGKLANPAPAAGFVRDIASLPSGASFLLLAQLSWSKRFSVSGCWLLREHERHTLHLSACWFCSRSC